MTKKEAREEAVKRWGKHAIVSIVNNIRYIVADETGVRGASMESFEDAFLVAEALGVRKAANLPKGSRI